MKNKSTKYTQINTTKSSSKNTRLTAFEAPKPFAWPIVDAAPPALFAPAHLHGFYRATLC